MCLPGAGAAAQLFIEFLPSTRGALCFLTSTTQTDGGNAEL